MLSQKQIESVKRMTNQFVAAAEIKHGITEPERLEKIMRRSVLKQNKEILELAILEMKQLTK